MSGCEILAPERVLIERRGRALVIELNRPLSESEATMLWLSAARWLAGALDSDPAAALTFTPRRKRNG
jgi:hypothetical protein